MKERKGIATAIEVGKAHAEFCLKRVWGDVLLAVSAPSRSLIHDVQSTIELRMEMDAGLT